MSGMQRGGIVAIVSGSIFLSVCVGVFIYWLKRSFTTSSKKDNKKSMVFFIKKLYMKRRNSVAPIQVDVEEQCSICLCELDISQMNVATIVKCGHMFHLDCLMTWIVKRNICPLCRYQIPTVHKHIQLLLPNDPSTHEVHNLSEWNSESNCTTESRQTDIYPV